MPQGARDAGGGGRAAPSSVSTDALTEDMMAVLPKKKIPDRRHAACVAATIAALNASALLPAGGETIATFTRKIGRAHV